MLTFLLSAALVLIGGYFAGKLAQRNRMLPVLGMLMFGILVGPSVPGLNVHNLDGGLTLTTNGNWLAPIPAPVARVHRGNKLAVGIGECGGRLRSWERELFGSTRTLI